MSNSTADLRRKIDGAGDLQGVVKTMKALAASSVGQYEKSVASLREYSRALELSLGVCLREAKQAPTASRPKFLADSGEVCAVILGSDQGMVGQFNALIVNFAVKALKGSKGRIRVWAVGERVKERLADAGLSPERAFLVPGSVQGIVSLVGEILVAREAPQGGAEGAEMLLFFNRSVGGALFEPARQRLLPLDDAWARKLTAVPWPSKVRPQILGPGPEVLRALIREYLFTSLFNAGAESLASENASRLAAMQRADKNIDERLEDLHRKFHRLRQGGIDEELFDVLSGFEALSPEMRD